MALAPGALGNVRAVTTTASASLMIRQPGSYAAEALHRGLRAAGHRVVVVPTAYDAVVEAARAPAPFRYLLAGIDFFGRNEFGLIPLVRREWPETVIVAYQSPGFEHKARVAELLGAHIILATPEETAAFIEGLAPSPAVSGPAAMFFASSHPARPQPAPESPVPREPPREEEPHEAPGGDRPADLPLLPPPPDRTPQEPVYFDDTDAGADREPQAETTADEPRRQPVDKKPPTGQPRHPPSTPVESYETPELTEEELRILLGNDEDL